jgi:hypothetical protein
LALDARGPAVGSSCRPQRSQRFAVDHPLCFTSTVADFASWWRWLGGYFTSPTQLSTRVVPENVM